MLPEIRWQTQCLSDLVMLSIFWGSGSSEPCSVLIVLMAVIFFFDNFLICSLIQAFKILQKIQNVPTLGPETCFNALSREKFLNCVALALKKRLWLWTIWKVESCPGMPHPTAVWLLLKGLRVLPLPEKQVDSFWHGSRRAVWFRAVAHTQWQISLFWREWATFLNQWI